MISLRKAKLGDIAQMQKMVYGEIEEGIILPRSDDEVATNIRSYILAVKDNNILGYGALHIHSPRLGEIRSLIVDSKNRGKSIGTMLVKKALEEAKELGLKEVLVLTYLPNFFEKLGFTEIAKESIPEHKIWADCIKCKHFPMCNEVSLIYNLQG